MSNNKLCGLNLMVAAAVMAALPRQVLAGEAPAEDELYEVAEVVVYATRFRDRVDDTAAPVLSYDLEYFQKFEPNTVGDMLKRLPGVSFVGTDVMEYGEGLQLRGLTGGYTQVLINGKKVPGAGDDRSFWVDRIPAEMVERVEVLRSNSASRSGDAVAGAINIILKDSYSFDGTYARAGLNRWDDGEVNPTFGLVTSGDLAGGRALAGINVQDRYRGKLKRSDRFEDDSQADLVSWENQEEIKDGRDYSLNLSYTAGSLENAKLSFDGFYVKTDRDVREVSFEEELDGGDTLNIRVPGLNPVNQENWGLGGEYEFSMVGGKTTVRLDYARFEDDSSVTEEEHVYISDASNFDQTWSIDGAVWDESVAEAEAVDAADSETGVKLAHKRAFLGNTEVEFGTDFRFKKRNIEYTFWDWEADNEGDPVVYALDGSIASRIKEERIDPYLQFSGMFAAISWEAGLRFESTDTDIRYSEDGDVEGAASTDYSQLLPSAHMKWDLTGNDRITLSAARSMKRPNFNELIPALLDGEYGDNDYIGNPLLKPEVATGLDLGYERRLGSQGVVGVNLFYRRIEDLNELVNTGLASEDYLQNIGDDAFGDEDYGFDFIEDYLDANPGATPLQAQAALEAEVVLAGEDWDPDSWLFTSGNVGNGDVWGIELDLATPLTVFGLDNTGVFANFSWVESEVKDFLGTRRFNDQAKSAFNLGFIQQLPGWGASFGATFRKQGTAQVRILAEEATIKYGEELDLFLEKTFGRKVSLRLSANNLLDASKDEVFDKFDNQGDQEDRDYDEFELETEEAGPSYQLVLRWAF